MKCLVKSKIHTHMTSCDVIFLQNAARIIQTAWKSFKTRKARKMAILEVGKNILF